MSIRNPDRREGGRKAIERRIGGRGVPNILEPPPPPPARPTGGFESPHHFETTPLREQQEQPSIVTAVTHLYEKTTELKEENQELRGQVDALVDSVKKLNGFVRAALDLMSDEEHSADFMRNHMDRFFELLNEHGISTEKDKKKKEDKQDGDVRGDIANRLNNIQ